MTTDPLPGDWPTKARSASVTLYHMDPGHHREASMWHDADHKAEVIASVPGVFISQRWVTPPSWIPLRPPSDLPEGGGEYVNVYWCSHTADELSTDFGRLGSALDSVGRMDTVRYMHLIWPTGGDMKMRPAFFAAGPKLSTSPAAITSSTAMTGLVSVVGTGPTGDFDRWYESEYIPKVLGTDLFAGAAQLAVGESQDGRGTYITLLYLDTPNPADAYVEYREHVRFWTEAGGVPDSWDGHETVFETVAQPSIGRYDVYE